MPVFEIGLDDGRKLHIEADDQQAALAGVEHFRQTDQPSGVIAGLRQGAAGLIHGPAETLKQYGGMDTSGAENAAQSIGQDNYKSAPIVDKEGFHAGNIPQAIAESAPGMAADITAAKLASKIPLVGKYAALPAGIASYLLRTRGDAAVERAHNRTGDDAAVPNAQDKAIAAGTGVVESVPQALLLGRFLPGANAVKATGLKGASEAVGKHLTTGAVAGASSGVSDVVSQVGATAGTDDGVQVDPYRAANAVASGAATGHVLAAPKLVGDVSTATKYRAVTPELQDAATRVANRMVDAADGHDLSSQKVGKDALDKAHAGIQNELSDAITDFKSRGTLSPDASNALDSIKAGRKPSERDYRALEASVQADPRGQNVIDLARDAHAATILRGTGNISGEKFTGGISAKLQKVIGFTTHGAAKAAIGALAVEHLGSHIIAQSPEMLALAGGTIMATKALDKATGAASPANRWVKKFADPTKGVRTPQAPLPVLPQAPVNRPGPTGPIVPQMQMPWGNEPPPDGTKAQMRDAAELMASRRANSKLQRVLEIAQQKGVREQVADAQAQMAARKANTSVQAQDAQSLMAARRAHLGINVKDATDLMAARRANAKIAQAQAKSDADAEQFAAADAGHAAYAQQTPQAPVISRIKKTNGKVKEEAAAPVDTGYTPLAPEQMPYYRKSDGYKANEELAKTNVDADKASKYRESIIKADRIRRGHMAELSADHEVDADHMAELLEQMKHIRRRSIAKNAVEHYARMMSPEGAAAVKGKFNTDLINSLWPK